MKLKFAIHTFSVLVPLLTLTAASAQTTQPVPASHSPHVAAAYGNIPLQFEENRGQTDTAAKFLSRGPGYSILLQPDAATIVLHRSQRQDLHSLTAGSSATHTDVVRMQLAGADPKAQMTAQQPLQGYVNYMSGPDHSQWKLGVPTFAQTRVTGTYPGIDLVYYGTQRQMEYDFVVAPHADASLIHLSITGAKPIVTPDGALTLQAKSGRSTDNLQFRKPVLYQQVDGRRKSIDGSFAVATNGTVGFKVGKYDHSRELVIDPIISYAGYFGGAGEDEINGSALNASNQLYAVGQTFSASLPGTTGEFETGSAANNNGHDAFVTKFSADGSSILWTTYLSGAGDDFATGVAVNNSDQPYVVGYTNSCGDGGLNYATAGEFPFVGGVQQLCNPDDRGFNNYESNGGGYDAFVVKLSSDGKSELAGTPLGGTANDIATGVVLSANGNVYVVGETYSTQYVLSPRSNDYGYQDVPSYPINNHGVAGIPGPANYPTTTTAFYTNTTESQLNSAYYPNGAGGIIAGTTQGPQDEQAFVTVLSADLSSIVYSSLLGGTGIGGCGNGACNTNGLAIAVNANGNAFIGGNTSSAHWPVTAGAFASACANAGTATSQCAMTGWLAGFDPTKSGAASLLFNTYMTGSTAGKDSNGNSLHPGSDVFGLATDSTGNVIATGDTSSTDFPTTTGTLQPACTLLAGDGNGNTNTCSGGFITKLTPAGATVWSTYYAGTTAGYGTVNGEGVTVDANNNVYMVGLSTNPTLMLKNAISTNASQQSDAVLIELNPTASTLLMGTYLGTGGGIIVNNNSLHLDSNMSAYFSGYQGVNPYGGTYFPVTANAADKTIQGNDGFVVKIITQQQPSVTTLAVSPSPATPSQTVTLTATLTTPSTITGSLLPAGTVTFYNNTSTVIGTATLNTSGIATYTGTLAAGAYNITASYPGNTAFISSVSIATPLTVSSSSATATTLTVAPPTSAYGTAEVLTATVKSGTAAATGGTVTFAAGNVTLGTATVNSSGIATLSVTPAAGVYTVIASYAGTYNQTTNPNGFGSSASSGVALTITKASSTTVLTSSAAQAGTAVNLTLTATVPSAATGSVIFYSGTTSLGTGTVANGVATLSTSFATAGTYSLTAVYGGDSNFNASTSAVLTEIVATPTFSVTAAPASLTITRGSTGTTTLTLTPTGGFTGAVTLTCGTLPSKATCAFNPATVTLGASAVTEVLTIGTGSLSASLAAPQFFNNDHRGVIYSASLLGLPGSILVLLGLSHHRKLSAPALRASLMATICMLTLGVLSGCGGSSSSTTATSNATPAGTYTLSVTLTSGTATQTVPLTVIVQ